MAKKILKGVGGLLGIGGKKKAASTSTTAEQKGPIVTQLAPGTVPPNRRRTVAGRTIGQDKATILGGLGGRLGL